MKPPITPQEAALRERVIEQVLGAVENRWIERCIRRAAEVAEDPAGAARKAAGTMGYAHDGIWWDTSSKGIRVQTLSPSTEFVIPWREVAEAALGARKPQQVSLL